jgi:stearoyl-CoA desaturase (delta-9 desaturase)
MVVVALFVTHWFTSVFCQTFFLHRYGAHRQFEMSKGWERFFHLLTFVSQGASYLDPRAYAILHREHHAFSDTERDPHSPKFFNNALSMMWTTKGKYEGYVDKRVDPEPRFDGGYPDWPALERVAQPWLTRAAFAAAFTLFYWAFATELWMWALLPAHWLMGPIHGAIVNWSGHKYGYRNFDSDDDSRNSLAVDFLTMGELFQNNHHKYGQSPNFAVRWFEIDPCYQIMRVLARFKIIDFGPARQQTRTDPAARPGQRHAA